MPKNTPQKIGRYPVSRLLGRGAMGSVYLARDTELDRDVAIKTVRNIGTTDEERDAFLIRFRNEARAVGRLKHPSIVAVYDVGTDELEGPYLVFEYVEGATLKEVLHAKGPLAPSELLSVAEQIGDALEVAHREGIIHRDIKPENLLVGSDGITRLLDFGVARVPDAALTGEGQFLGTPCYAAPETLRGGAAVAASDQFSFAAVLYEACTGARAFPGSEAIAVAHRVVNDEPLPPSKAQKKGATIPAGLDEVLTKGLSKKPEDRYDRIAQLIVALRSVFADAGLVRPPSVADTLPLVRMSAASTTRRSVPTGPVRRRLVWWPFVAAASVGGIVMLQLAPSTPVVESADVAADGQQVGPASEEDTPAPSPALADGAVSAAVQDASLAAAKADAAAHPADEPHSAFEREERAKDALERAQEALEAGDLEAARAALDEAFRYDPEHPDIAALRRKL